MKHAHQHTHADGTSHGHFHAPEWVSELASWVLSEEGQAACRAAIEFSRRTGIAGSLDTHEICALLVAAHEAEVRARQKGKT